jgi:hypothetical protein
MDDAFALRSGPGESDALRAVKAELQAECDALIADLGRILAAPRDPAEEGRPCGRDAAGIEAARGRRARSKKPARGRRSGLNAIGSGGGT